MIYIFISVIFYSIALILLTAASRAINSSLVTALVNTVSAFIPIALILPMLNKKTFIDGKYGVLLAILAGIAIAIYTLAINKSFQVNKVAIVSPIVFGGAIFITAILSYFIFKEKISPMQLIGLLLIGGGLATIVFASITGK